MKIKSDLSASYVRSILSYDLKTGEFIWLIGKRRGYKTGVTPGSRGYTRIKIDGSTYQAHRIAYLLVRGRWPAGDLDHVDLNKKNNAWDNLREASDSQNQANKLKDKRNTSGIKGVFWFKQYECWKASIQIDRKEVFLGYFEDKEKAATAYATASKKYFGDFARPD